MESMLDVMETTIPRGRTLRIRDGKGFSLKVVAGCLWVTQDGDTEDAVLDAGETFRVSGDGVTLVHAFKEVRLRIGYPTEAGAPSVTLGGGYREVGASVVRTMLAERLQEIRGWIAAGARAGRNGFTFNTGAGS
ncbi:MAG TPA: DUF2917 domain-containing protein [Burkholderiales bacterium]|nr:DUF2917 domain-containing protein [Burkholderiales bacterium]